MQGRASLARGRVALRVGECRYFDDALKGGEAECVNEYGGLFQGKPLGADGVACFRKTGRLSADGLTITWSDGVIGKRHGPAPK